MRQMTKIHRLFFTTEEQNPVFCTLQIDVEKDYNTDVNYLLYSHGFQSECLSRIRAAGILSITGWCGNILFGSLSITGAHRQKRCASPIGPRVHPDLTVWVDRQILHLDAQEKSRLSAGLFLISASGASSSVAVFAAAKKDSSKSESLLTGRDMDFRRGRVYNAVRSF